MNRLRLLLPLSLAALSACSGGSVKDTLGISRSAPDEFRVVARPPLSVPPQFNLRPPGTGEASPIITPADKEARALVLGAPAAESANTFRLQPETAPAASPAQAPAADNSAESVLLRKAGAAQADTSIRRKLIEEKASVVMQEEEDPWWQILPDTSKEPMVNAKGEAERIKQNSAQGKPVTEGETPEIKGKDTGVLGKIFGY